MTAEELALGGLAEIATMPWVANFSVTFLPSSYPAPFAWKASALGASYGAQVMIDKPENASDTMLQLMLHAVAVLRRLNPIVPSLVDLVDERQKVVDSAALQTPAGLAEVP